MLRFSLRHLVAIVAVIAAVGGLYAYFNRSPLVELFGGVQNLEIVRAPTRVEAYRLGEPPGGLPLENYVSPLDYPVTKGPITVPDRLAAKVAEALLAKQTYGWDYAKACGFPVYGVKLSFYKNADRVDVYFCFLCDFLTVTANEKATGGEDFDNARGVFVSAAKELFPDDGVIQKLRD